MSRPDPGPSTRPPASPQARCLRMLEARLGHGRRPLYRALAYVLVLAAAASLSMLAVVDHFTARQTARNDRLKHAIASVDGQLAELVQIKSVLQSHLTTQRTVERLQGARCLPALDLSAVSRALPDGVRLGEIGFDDGSLVLRGTALSAARVGSLIRNLDETYAGGVTLQRLEAANGGEQPAGAVAFIVSATWQPAAQEDLPAAGTAAAEAQKSAEAPDDASTGAIVAALTGVLLVGGGVLWSSRLRHRRAGAAATCESGAQRLLSSLAHTAPADPERWPLAVRLFFLAEILVLALAAAWWGLLAPQIDALREQVQTEVALKEDFAGKTRQVASRALYAQQLKDVEQGFAARLKRLPERFDDAALLIEINQAALGRGLAVRRLHPQGEVNVGEDYATQSWAIQLAGEFDDIGEFVADMGRLGRLTVFPKYRLSAQSPVGTAVLFDATLETYRALNVEEIAIARQRAALQRTKKP